MTANETMDIWAFREDDLNYMSKRLLMDSPTLIFIIWVLYFIFIKKIGPYIMKDRPPYNLRNILIVYNAVQVILSGCVVYMGAPILWKYGLIPKCLDNKNDSIGYITTLHFYYLLKVTELLDTVFFVLRKKFNQASFLHVYHHSYMVISTWFIIRYDPTYATLFPGTINSFVHVIMYTYYMLSAFPSLARYLWWKKYITSMQLIQFVMIIAHLLRSYHTSKCPPTFLMAYSMSGNCALFIFLFSEFYIRSYKQNKSKVMNGKENGRIVQNKINAESDSKVDSAYNSKKVL